MADEGRKVHLFGIRHHGPGSARSLLRALEELSPDLVLIEGPEDATPALEWVANEKLVPPVALLLYEPGEPKRCFFDPFVEFSPEWQALRFAAARKVPARFIDLPATHVLAMRKADEEACQAAESKAEDGEEELANQETPEQPLAWEPVDPLQMLADAAGYSDAERWWESIVEQRADSAGVFDAIAEAMTTVRGEIEKTRPGLSPREAAREAWMRQSIRAAEKEGFQRIAVVCGAWHVPALATMPKAKDDAAILKGLPKLKVTVTWAPWTHTRLTSSSGYGAGVLSPGWYEFLWQQSGIRTDARKLCIGWLARVAAVLRDEDFDVSSAHLIEATRLAEALCSIRDIALPGLEELNEAIVACLLFGDTAPLELIRKKLIVGEALGTIPPEVPAVPLQTDFEKQATSLRLKRAADSKDYDLDLRSENDLARSHFLHRLSLLGIHWGKPIQSETRSRGTFRESWRLQWVPELSVNIIEASVWGSTVEAAAAEFVVRRASEAQRLPQLTELAQAALLADLPSAMAPLMQRLEAMTAAATDAGQLMDALPPLADASRYGSVRKTDLDALGHLIDTIVVRICVGIGGVCASLDDEAAESMQRRITRVDGAVRLLEITEHVDNWRNALESLSGQNGLHGLVAGSVTRILFEAERLDAAESSRRLSLALSRAVDATASAHWIAGFLGSSAAILLHHPALMNVLDTWVCALNPEQFRDVLPMLRRAFSSFPAPERRQIGERLLRQSGPEPVAHAAATTSGVDTERADLVLPVLRLILAGGTS